MRRVDGERRGDYLLMPRRRKGIVDLAFESYSRLFGDSAREEQ